MDTQTEIYAAITALSAATAGLMRLIEALIGKIVYKKSDHHFNIDDRHKLTTLYENLLENRQVNKEILIILKKIDIHLEKNK